MTILRLRSLVATAFRKAADNLCASTPDESSVRSEDHDFGGAMLALLCSIEMMSGPQPAAAVALEMLGSANRFRAGARIDPTTHPSFVLIADHPRTLN